eukprot:SAG11_NODE_7937_length_1079_cov_1.271429_1_plen_62_part_00
MTKNPRCRCGLLIAAPFSTEGTRSPGRTIGLAAGIERGAAVYHSAKGAAATIVASVAARKY